MNYLVYIKGVQEKSAKEVCMCLREWCKLFISPEKIRNSRPQVTPPSDYLVDKMKNLMKKEDEFAAGPSSVAEIEEKDEEISSNLPGKFLKIFCYYSSSTLLI